MHLQPPAHPRRRGHGRSKQRRRTALHHHRERTGLHLPSRVPQNGLGKGQNSLQAGFRTGEAARAGQVRRVRGIQQTQVQTRGNGEIQGAHQPQRQAPRREGRRGTRFVLLPVDRHDPRIAGALPSGHVRMGVQAVGQPPSPPRQGLHTPFPDGRQACQ